VPFSNCRATDRFGRYHEWKIERGTVFSAAAPCITGIGTGGTIAGVGRRLREQYPNIRVIGVEPPPGDSIQGLKCLEALEEVPPFLDLSLITERTYVTSQQAAEATRQMLDKEGIFAGLSSGAVVHQAIKVANEMDEGNIVVVLADGGWKYLSLNLWK